MSRNIFAAIAVFGLFAIPVGNADSEGFVPDACEQLPILSDACRDAIEDWSILGCFEFGRDCFVCLEFNPGAVEISPEEIIPDPDLESRAVSIWWIGMGPSDGSFTSLSRPVAGSYILWAGLDDFDGCMNVH